MGGLSCKSSYSDDPMYSELQSTIKSSQPCHQQSREETHFSIVVSEQNMEPQNRHYMENKRENAANLSPFTQKKLEPPADHKQTEIGKRLQKRRLQASSGPIKGKRYTVHESAQDALVDEAVRGHHVQCSSEELREHKPG